MRSVRPSKFSTSRGADWKIDGGSQAFFVCGIGIGSALNCERACGYTLAVLHFGVMFGVRLRNRSRLCQWLRDSGWMTWRTCMVVRYGNRRVLVVVRSNRLIA